MKSFRLFVALLGLLILSSVVVGLGKGEKVDTGLDLSKNALWFFRSGDDVYLLVGNELARLEGKTAVAIALPEGAKRVGFLEGQYLVHRDGDACPSPAGQALIIIDSKMYTIIGDKAELVDPEFLAGDPNAPPDPHRKPLDFQFAAYNLEFPYFLTLGQLCRLEGTKIVAVKIPAEIPSPILAAANETPVLISQNQLWVYADEAFKLVTAENGEKLRLPPVNTIKECGDYLALALVTGDTKICQLNGTVLKTVDGLESIQELHREYLFGVSDMPFVVKDGQIHTLSESGVKLFEPAKGVRGVVTLLSAGEAAIVETKGDDDESKFYRLDKQSCRLITGAKAFSYLGYDHDPQILASDSAIAVIGHDGDERLCGVVDENGKFKRLKGIDSLHAGSASGFYGVQGSRENRTIVFYSTAD